MNGGVPGARVLAGKYRLTERIAQGGMGTVWRAEHLQLHMPVAVKLMSPVMLQSDTFRFRFEREALAAAQLRSRHVVTVHDYGIDGDEPFMVMELLDGEDLAARLRRDRRLAPEAAALVVGQIARALDRAHAAGLVHRDLKPANVFLARIDDEEVVKVLDFGIAKAFGDDTSDDVTGDDEVLGTPLYMSPEQIRKSAAIGPRADLWALSVIAYRMITGALPFTGETRGDIVVRVCSEPHAPPSSREPSLGPAVDQFFDRALAKLPQDRFESARSLAAALDMALGTDQAAQRVWQRVSMFEIPASALALVPPPSFGPGSVPPPSFGPGSVPPPPFAPPSHPPPSFAPTSVTPPSFPAGSTPLPSFTPAAIHMAAMPSRDPPETTLSLRPTNVQPPQLEPERARRRVLVAGVAIAALSAGVAVTVGLSMLGGRGEPAPELAASSDLAPPAPVPAVPASLSAVVAASVPTAEATASATAAPTAAPTATATASATASVSAAPAPPVKPNPSRRRKVVIGL